jgi:hypothetical protein
MTNHNSADVDEKAYQGDNVTIVAPGCGISESGDQLILTDDYNEHGQTIGCSWKPYRPCEF